jgi:tripartite-type tricarboxylate transporter receptor subunit TctC
MKRHSILFAMVLGIFNIASSLASAAEYPGEPIQIVVPFPAGGNTDLVARVVAERLQASFKSPVIVLNRPGAGTNIGAALVANSKPDGHMMLIGAPASFVINQFIYSNLTYDPDKSFAPVSVAAQFPNVLVVHPSLGVKSIQELIDKAKANPGKIPFASSGVGTTSQLSVFLFAQMAQIELLHIPYTGTSQSLQDLLAGRVVMTIDNLAPLLPFIKSGQLLALGVSTKDPVALLPDVPIIGSVLNGYALNSWNVLAMPAETPPDIVGKVSAECDRILHMPDVATKLRSFGSEPGGGTPAQVAAFLKAERVRWEAAVKAAKISKGQLN